MFERLIRAQAMPRPGPAQRRHRAGRREIDPIEGINLQLREDFAGLKTEPFPKQQIRLTQLLAGTPRPALHTYSNLSRPAKLLTGDQTQAGFADPKLPKANAAQVKQFQITLAHDHPRREEKR